MSLHSKIEPAAINIKRDITKCLTCHGFIASEQKCCFNAFSPFVLGMGSSRPTEILCRSMSGNLWIFEYISV